MYVPNVIKESMYAKNDIAIALGRNKEPAFIVQP